VVIEDNRNSCIELARLAYNYQLITTSYFTSQVTSVGYLEKITRFAFIYIYVCVIIMSSLPKYRKLLIQTRYFINIYHSRCIVLAPSAARGTFVHG
jgi:hypothetical protein